MTRRLILLRHAKAEHPHGMADHARPLALAGRRQAATVGRALAEDGLVPDLVLCSSALRTRQTWELVQSTLGTTVDGVEYRDEVYDAGTGDVVALVTAVPDDVETVLVVGHEPTMSHVAEQLAGPASDPAAFARVRVGVPTASWSLLETTTGWGEVGRGSMVLARLVTPS
ncbi:SixA phosphatase family protein [Cellulomonas massiliensis]|uniref:SixA phosphatase family protein n=1 Tax=Cellulomonas massiliensis TaxID=1465811 RepID=UPI0002EAEA95|nr:histidine phosphatase family protein [Cellulomonas massiliensis]